MVPDKMSKRLFDFLCVVPGIVVLSPLMVLVAAWIKIDSPGPVFFQQSRVGKEGKEFRMYKFRTMVPNAEKIGAKITIGGDPRITRSGRFLRKYKLDELPQLFNVLLGQMSLVGPRPEVPSYVKFYPEAIREKVLSIKPGITDLASLKYRDEGTLLQGVENPAEVYINDILPHKLDYYMQYIDQHTLRLDFKIILQTLISIVK